MPNANGVGIATNESEASPEKSRPFVKPTYVAPIAMPIKIALKRSQWLVDAFKNTITSNTPRPTAKFSVLAKSAALKPPARSVIPTFIKLRPIAVITIPVVKGVIMRLSLFTNRLNTTSTNAPAMVRPNSRAKISSGVPPFAFTWFPAKINALINAKLVP